MMTQKEAVYTLMAGKKIDTIINGWEPFRLVFDEIIIGCNPPAKEGETTSVDCWGVTFRYEEGQQNSSG